MKICFSGRLVRLCLAFSLLMVFVVKPAYLSAQAPVLQYSIQYVVEYKDYFVVADTAWQPSQMEIYRMQPHTVRDSVIKTVTADNQIKTTIFHLENTRFPAWMQKPYKTVIDGSKTKIFSGPTELMLQKDHSPMFLEQYNQLKDSLTLGGLDVIPVFTFLTNKLRNDLIFQGYTMSKVPGGFTRFVKDSVELMYNNKKYVYERRHINPEGQVYYFEKTGFIKNNSNQVVPSFTIVRKAAGDFSGGQVQEVKVVTYNAYTITPGPAYRQAEAADSQVYVSVYPNPVEGQTLVEWNSSSQPHWFCQVLNTSGVVLMQINDITESERLIDLSSLPAGLYILRAYDDHYQWTEKLIKM